MASKVRERADLMYSSALDSELTATINAALRWGSEAHCHFKPMQCHNLVEHWDAERCAIFASKLSANWRNLSPWYLHNMRQALQARREQLAAIFEQSQT